MSIKDDDDQPIKLLDEPEEQHRVQIASPPLLDQTASPLDDPALLQHSTTEAKKSSKSQNTVFSSFPNTPNWQTPVGSPKRGPSEASSDDDDDDSDSDLGERLRLESDQSDHEWGSSVGLPNNTRPARSPAQKQFRAFVSRSRHILRKYVWVPLRKTARVVKEFLTPPLWSVLLSIFICFIPPLQRFLDTLVPFKE